MTITIIKHGRNDKAMHFRGVCENCECEFKVAPNDEILPERDPWQPDRPARVRCPDCGYLVTLKATNGHLRPLDDLG